jgi:hypothetical protein
MEVSEHYPYCIWYPDPPSEKTCRQLASRDPRLRYNVSLICAIADYTELYEELHLLPEVSIAEEARESPHGKDIYDSIMSKSPRYAVMDDYTRSINVDSPHRGAFLNADTAVRSTLDIRYTLKGTSARAADILTFNITEDASIDEVDAGNRRAPLTSDEITLLYNPLLQDLPTMNKDLLILMAA